MRRERLDERDVEHDGVRVRAVVERVRDPFNRDGGMMVECATVHAAHDWGPLAVEAAAGSYFFAFGRQDALVGHPGFDDRYIVKTSDEVALRYWFGLDEAEAVLATYDPHALHPYALTIEPGQIRLVASWHYPTWPPPERIPVRGIGAAITGEWTTPSLVTRLDEAIAAVAHLAGRGRRLATGWRDRLASLGLVEAQESFATDERYALTLERGRTRIRLDFPWQVPALRSHGLRTRLTIPWPDPGAAVLWPRTWSWRARPRIDRGRDLRLPAPWHGEAHDAEALLSLPQREELLTALGIEWLIVGDGRLAVGWERIVDDPERLGAVVTQLARWAEWVAPTRGPYR